MSLPGLKPSIELESGASPQLLNQATGQRLALSETEARLLQLWDGQQGATALSARLFVEGLDVEPWQVEQFFDRLAKAEVLAAGAPVVPDFVRSAAGVEELSDLVPTLRGDLIITKSKNSRGTLEVKDPLTERTFTLYDFEVSIARMLDGKRSAADVLAAANRLGIPVTLPTLKTFLQQLRAYQFIDQTRQGGETTWPRRRPWAAGVRELYQSALRLMRSGKYDEARGYVDALVEADPENEEAAALRARIEAEASGEFELLVPFDTLHTPLSTDAVAAPVAPPAADDPFASFGFNAAPPAPEALPPMPQELVAPRSSPSRPPLPAEPIPQAPALARPEEPSTEVLVETPRRSRRGLFIGLAGVAVVGLLLLLRPVEAQVLVTAELVPTELGVPHAPVAGTVREVPVATSGPVEKGQLLAQLTPGGLEPPELLQKRMKALEEKVAALSTPPPDKELARARLALKAAEKSLAPLLKKKARTPKRGLAALEKKIKPKQKAVDVARAAVEALTHEAARAALTQELEQLSAKKVAAEVQLERASITSPAAGLFLPPEPLPKSVAVDDAWGRVVDLRFVVKTTEPLPAGATAGQFESGAGKLEVELADGAATVAGEPRWAGAKGTLSVSSGRTPWVLRALGSSR